MVYRVPWSGYLLTVAISVPWWAFEPSVPHPFMVLICKFRTQNSPLASSSISVIILSIIACCSTSWIIPPITSPISRIWSAWATQSGLSWRLARLIMFFLRLNIFISWRRRVIERWSSWQWRGWSPQSPLSFPAACVNIRNRTVMTIDFISEVIWTVLHIRKLPAASWGEGLSFWWPILKHWPFLFPLFIFLIFSYGFPFLLSFCPLFPLFLLLLTSLLMTFWHPLSRIIIWDIFYAFLFGLMDSFSFLQSYRLFSTQVYKRGW